MKKKTFAKKRNSGGLYKKISLSPKNVSSVFEITGKSEYIRLEIDSEKWKDSQIANLKQKLKSLSNLIIRNITLQRSPYILNFLEVDHNRANCPFWERMISTDSHGNFVLAPSFASFKSKGVFLCGIDSDMSFYSSCVYQPGSEQCIECSKKNFKKMNKIWNMKAIDVFDSAILVLYESIKVLSCKNSKFKHYLEELKAIKNSKSEFLGGFKF